MKRRKYQGHGLGARGAGGHGAQIDPASPHLAFVWLARDGDPGSIALSSTGESTSPRCFPTEAPPPLHRPLRARLEYWSKCRPAFVLVVFRVKAKVLTMTYQVPHPLPYIISPIPHLAYRSTAILALGCSSSTSMPDTFAPQGLCTRCSHSLDSCPGQRHDSRSHPSQGFP